MKEIHRCHRDIGSGSRPYSDPNLSYFNNWIRIRPSNLDLGRKLSCPVHNGPIAAEWEFRHFVPHAEPALVQIQDAEIQEHRLFYQLLFLFIYKQILLLFWFNVFLICSTSSVICFCSCPGTWGQNIRNPLLCSNLVPVYVIFCS